MQQSDGLGDTFRASREVHSARLRAVDLRSWESALRVICSANIQRPVSAFEDVAEEHEADFCPSARPDILRRGSFRTNFFAQRKSLEAGGVEPPSEKRYGPKPTCLAHSVWFAGRAQNEQETLPASPIFLASASRAERRRPARCATPRIAPAGKARGDGLR